MGPGLRRPRLPTLRSHISADDVHFVSVRLKFSIGCFDSSEMVQPRHRVAADAAIALRDVRPVDVLFETDKHTQGSLVCAPASTTSSPSRKTVPTGLLLIMFVTSFSRQAPPGYGRNFGLFTSRDFSSLARSVSFSSAIRAASLCGASWSSSRFASVMAAWTGARSSFSAPTNRKVGPYEERIRSKQYCESCHSCDDLFLIPVGSLHGVGWSSGHLGKSIRGRNRLDEVVSRKSLGLVPVVGDRDPKEFSIKEAEDHFIQRTPFAKTGRAVGGATPIPG